MIDDVLKQIGGADAVAENFKAKILSSENRIISGGRTYHVSENGNDLNDGLSPQTAVKTYLQVSRLALEKGDSVLFERGCLFRTSDVLYLVSGVYYGAYGEGEKPKIYGSLKNYADVAFWKQKESNIWYCELATPERAGVTTFNNNTYIGVWKHTKSELSKDGDYYHDKESGLYYLYFKGRNPGEYFDSIEISTTFIAMNGPSVEDVRVENLCFKYNTFGPFLWDCAKHITISNCEMGWHGGKVCGMQPEGPVRYGNAVEFWHSAEDITVNNCWVYQVFDAAMTFQGCIEEGREASYFDNIRFENNLIEYCSMNIEWWAGTMDEKVPHIANISFKGNMIRFAGYGWGGIYRWDKGDQAMLLGWNYQYETLNFRNFVIENNVLDCSDCYMIYMCSPDDYEGLTVCHNTFYQKQYSGRHKHTAIIQSCNACAGNQEELENAITLFDKTPKLVKWID